MNREERFAALEKKPFTIVGGRSGGQVQSFYKTLLEVIANWNILALFVRRDIKSRYKDSSLGLVWTLIKPLTQLVIFYVVVGKFLGAERGIPLFAVYIFTGLTAFGLFSEIVSSGTASIISNAGLVKKVYVPRELFPLATVGTALFNFAVQFLILLAASLLLGSLQLSWNLLYLIPSMFVLLIFGLAAALLLSAWFVYLRDIGYFVEVLLMVLIWASPILYSWQMVRDVVTSVGLPWLLEIYTANPATLAVLGFQEAMYGAESHGLAMPDMLWLRLLIASVVGVLCVIGAQRVFARLQGNFAQEL